MMVAEVWVAGVGMTQFGKFPDRELTDVGAEAIVQALKTAGVPKKEIEQLYSGNVLGPMTLGQAIAAEVGVSGVPIFNVENACASGSSAFHLACQAVACGSCRIAVAVGVEQMSRRIKGLIPTDDDDLHGAQGLTFPGLFAMIAQRHMLQYGSTPRDFAAVSVKNHFHGSLNSRAQYRDRVTVDQVVASRMIADPLHLLECSPTGDGAAAAVLCDGKTMKRLGVNGARVAASVVRGGATVEEQPDAASFACTVSAASIAYNRAGLGPADVDFAEVHDCFSVAELLHYEDLGFCPRGEGPRLLTEGATTLGGRLPVNTSGGLLSKGHPLGATGVAQICELFWQLTGQAAERSVAGARVGLAHNLGGVLPGLEAAACALHILTR